MAKGVPVQIFRNNWTVLVTKSPKDLIVNNKQCKGCIVYKDSVIFLDENLSDKDRLRVLRHEVAHALLYETQISQKDCYTEEELCDFMAIYSPMVEEIVAEILKRMRG